MLLMVELASPGSVDNRSTAWPQLYQGHQN